MSVVTISSTQQLFDLNKGLTNFKSTFEVTSVDNKPFYGVVVNQDILDQGSPLAFQYAQNGILSGDIIQAENIPKSWFLALKSDTPNRVTITINTVSVEPKVQQKSQSNVQTPKAKKKNILNLLLIISLLGIAAFFALKFLRQRKAVSQTSSGAPVVMAMQATEPLPTQDFSEVLGKDLAKQIQNLPLI